MLAFSNDYYGLIFRATQSVELFCAYEESGINDKIKAELSEAKIKGVDKIKPDKMTLRNSLSIMDI